MRYEGYKNLIVSPNKLEFKFVSEGPAGKIIKVIQFSQTGYKKIYNLAFGNLRPDGSLDDQAISNNNDRNKILRTIVTAIHEFYSVYSDKFIFFCGNTPQRNRLYRMALAINLTELRNEFHIYGLIKKDGRLERVNFRTGVDYFGFMIKRKKHIFK
jgi:hypothetical protein